MDHSFTDSFRAKALGGTTRSRGKLHDATVNYDIRNYNGFTYDYTNAEYPLLQYNGLDVTDATNFQVTELRDRYRRTVTGFDTAELDLQYDIIEELKLAAGVNYKRATLDTYAENRDGLVCNLTQPGPDGMPVPFYAGCNTGGGIYGPPGQAALSDQIEYPGDVGAGSNTRWASPQIDAWFAELGYGNVPLNVDQDGTYSVTEKNLGYYLQTKGEIPFGETEMRLMYDAGVRYVQTRQSSTGYNSGVQVTIDRPMYDDWLPSANAALWLTEEVVLRLAAAQVMSRPALDNLSPGGTVDSFNFEVDNQNPFLEPTRALALDAGAEWYFADGSVLSLAVFMKDIESFPITAARTGTFASTRLPRSVIQGGSPADVSGPGAEGTCGVPEGCWQISELTNGPGATVRGLEVGFQAPLTAFFDNLPPVIDGLGVVANYTLVDSEVDYTFNDEITIKERLFGLSNHSYNATLYYEDAKFGARLSVAQRSNFLTNGPNSANNLWEYTETDTRLDASSSYILNDHLRFTLEGLNLLDTPNNTRVDIDAQRPNVYSHTGRIFLLGARVSL
jgi:TonB-dependent receptor